MSLSDTARNDRWAEIVLLIITALALVTVIHNVPLLSGNPVLFEPAFQAKYMMHWPVVFTHSLTAMAALAVGGFQFHPLIRKRYPRVHRNIGKIYILSVFFAAPTGLIMGTIAEGGLVAQATFVVLSVLWFCATLQGFLTVIARNFKTHRIWMLRSFALTFGAVVLRLELMVLQRLGFDFFEVYPWVGLASWIPCLVVAELMAGNHFQKTLNAPSLAGSGSRIHKAHQ